jgi:phosphatidylglycerol:prolipoprotein diacylglycerol transferase
MNSAHLLTIRIGLDPTLFDVIGLEITWHGLFTALGVVAGVAVAAWFARRVGFPEDTIYNVALALVVGGIIGARLLYVLENAEIFIPGVDPDVDADPWRIFEVNTGGISIYGAFIGGTLGAWLYAMVRRLPDIPRAADIAAMGGILGLAVGRIGDIINGEHFSSTTDLPWGVVYTDPNSPSFIRFGEGALPQHPAVAYELIGSLVIFALLVAVYLRVGRSGVTFFAWVFLYGLLRILVSFLRLDEIVWLGLRTAQLIALAAMPIGLAGVAYLLSTPPLEERLSRAERRRLARKEAAEEQSTG